MMPNYNPDHLYWEFLKTNPQKKQIVPKIIHQMWLGGNPPMNLINTWKIKNPSWKHILWTEENLKKWKFHNQNKIETMKEPNGHCDIMRYEILYKMGGFFVDVDTICKKPLDNHLFNYDCISVYENEKQRGGLVACGFMAAQPKCNLLKLCIEEMEISKSPAWWYVGPAYFTHIIQKYNYPIKIHPSHYFIPNHYTGEIYSGNGPVYCDHLWGGTYENGYEKLKSINDNTNQIDKPKIQPRQLKLRKIDNSRRKSILNQFHR
jgi:mannosyltransferase OCH1-like enzyme